MSGGLAPGLTISPTGLISGTPTDSGVYAFDVRARDATGATCTREVILVVTPTGSVIDWNNLVWDTPSASGGLVATITPAIAGFSYSFKGGVNSSPPPLNTAAQGTLVGRLVYSGPPANCHIDLTVTRDGNGGSNAPSNLTFYVTQDGVSRLVAAYASNGNPPIGITHIPFTINGGFNSNIEFKFVGYSTNTISPTDLRWIEGSAAIANA